MPESIKEQLDRDGYVVLEEFLQPNECEELVAAGLELTQSFNDIDVKRIFSTDDQTKLNKLVNDEYFIESNDKIRYFFEADAFDSDGKLKVDRSVALNKVGHALHFLHPIFRCYSYSERVKSVCRALGLQDPAIVQSMYIYKNPGVGGVVIPHQDSTYLHTEPISPIGFWIALDDATIQNGCLWIVRGSHKSGVHRRLLRSAEDGHTLTHDKPRPVYPESSFTPVPVPKGGCILLHGQVVHRSAANKSEKSRHAYTFHVIEKLDNNYSKENWLQEGPGAPFTSIYTTKQIE